MSDFQATFRSRPKTRSFRRVVLRGLTLLLPPILTIVALVWVVNTVDAYVLQPVTAGTREVIVWGISDIRVDPPGVPPALKIARIDDRLFTRLESGEYVPSSVVDWLSAHAPPVPASGAEVYERYVANRYLSPRIVIPVFLCVFVLFLYLLGKSLASEVGRLFDWGILRLPIVRKVYAAVKQVTDFVFGDSEIIEYKRVVAIEYPRAGMWSVGLVMGEAVHDVSLAANEPCVTVMLPTSPALFTVKPVMLPKRKTYDLNMTIDQALQFIISGGVVSPPRHFITDQSVVDEAKDTVTDRDDIAPGSTNSSS
jgi:uncharacterized membrane protein